MKKQQQKILLGIAYLLMLIALVLIVMPIFVDYETKIPKVGKWLIYLLGLGIYWYVRYLKSKEEEGEK